MVGRGAERQRPRSSPGGVARPARSVSTGLAARYRQVPEPGAIPRARVEPTAVAACFQMDVAIGRRASLPAALGPAGARCTTIVVASARSW